MQSSFPDRVEARWLPLVGRRWRLFELNEQGWLPAWWRDYETDYLEALFTRLGLYRRVAPLLGGLLRSVQAQQIVDLCSGAGGPILGLLDALGPEIEVLLSDKYPNLAAFERLAERSDGRIRFHRRPVDARAVPEELTGCRTLFDAFHHFPPPAALGILEDAMRSRVPIAVFDAACRSPAAILGSVSIPIVVLALTPWVRPFRWTRLLLTYLLPLLPIAIAWDGLVSHLRAYSEAELRALTAPLERSDYSWQVGALRSGPARITYVLGRPLDARAQAPTA